MTMTRTARGRHSIDRAGYADDIFEYAAEIQDGVRSRLRGMVRVSDIYESANQGWPEFEATLRLDSGDELTAMCDIWVDDDGELAFEAITEDGDDWESADLTATVNDDGSISTDDMSQDASNVIDAINTLFDRNR